MTHDEVERVLEVDMRELVRLLYQDHLTVRGEAAVPEAVEGADGVVRTHHERREAGRLVGSIFGPVRLARESVGANGVKSLHPVDADLNINNTLHNMTKRSALERRLDYEGTVPIAYGQYDEGLHNLKLTALPSGYNVSGNIAVGRDENGGFIYDYINQDYFGGSYNPLAINNQFTDILGNINNRLGLRPNIAFPSYGR